MQAPLRLLLLLALALPATVRAETPAERGYRWLRTRTYLPPDFDDAVFARLWERWPAKPREEARLADPATRRRLTLSRYGLVSLPKEDGTPSNRPLGYVHDGAGGWVMSCLLCHAGKVAGRVIPGLPNTHLDLSTLVEDVSLTKLALRQKLSHLDLVSLKLPLSTTRGTTNSVVFGVVLGAYRDKDMRVNLEAPAPKLLHHDMDAPPLWNVRHKTHLYCDAFAPKNHRVLMQFMLLPRNGPEVLTSWEPEFRDILAWIESLRPPAYPFAINQGLAAEGRVAFLEHCAGCHGTYGKGQLQKYPQRVVPLKTVGTDPLRLRALTPEHRNWMKVGWLSRYGKDPVEINPVGYLAPPLEGIWATAPYLHNGSVPTLWHMLHPARRPKVWSRSEDGYDRERVGLEIRESAALPATATTRRQRRGYFDTSKPGKSAGGHRFPEALTEPQRRAVLEFLKTL